MNGRYTFGDSNGGMMPYGTASAPCAAGCGSSGGGCSSPYGNEMYYGMDSGGTLIAAGAAATLVAVPARRNVPIRIALSETLVDQFIGTALTTGVDNILASTGNFSLAVFLADSSIGNFKSCVAEIALGLTLGVINIDSAAHRFVATVVGIPA